MRIEPDPPEETNAHGSNAPARGLDTERAIVRVERASAELRFGRPVVIESAEGDLAVLALDTASRANFDAFADLSEGRHSLYLTRERAGALGLDAPDGALVPLAGLDHLAACHLGYLRGNLAPQGWNAAGPTAAEAARLSRLALLLPAMVTVPLAVSACAAFADCPRVATGDLERAETLTEDRFEIVADTPVPLKDVAKARFVVFRGGVAQRDQVAIVVGDPDTAGTVPVRIHSSCLTGDLFGSLKCDCGDQLREGLRILEEKGGGVLLYLDQEGRGTGIAAKMRAYGLQAEGMDTVEADATLGFGADERRYDTAAAILDRLQVRRVDLLTNNPMKIAYLRARGIEVADRTSVTGTPTRENEGYLRTKVAKSGHMIDLDALFDGPDHP